LPHLLKMRNPHSIVAIKRDRFSKLAFPLVVYLMSLLIVFSFQLVPENQNPFSLLFGSNNLVIASIILSICGLTSIGILQSRLSFPLTHRDRRKMSIPIIFGGVLAFIMVLFDLLLPIQELIQLPLFTSIPFYFSISIFAETVFHLIPLCILLLLQKVILKNKLSGYYLYTTLLICALIEPVFQLLFFHMGISAKWFVTLFIFFHILLFNTIQLITFYKQGFRSMLLMRLTYYLIWHIAWGSLRFI